MALIVYFGAVHTGDKGTTSEGDPAASGEVGAWCEGRPLRCGVADAWRTPIGPVDSSSNFDTLPEVPELIASPSSATSDDNSAVFSALSTYSNLSSLTLHE